MALLDAAVRAEELDKDDPTLLAMSEGGLFEPMPGGGHRVLETPELRRALQRPISGSAESADRILSAIVTAVTKS